MIDDDHQLGENNPAKLLPRTVEFEPENLSAEKLPRVYIGTDEQVYGNQNIF